MRLVSRLKSILRNHYLKRKIVVNYFNTNYSKNCLIVYLTNPFISNTGVNHHQNMWQVMEIGNIFSSLGYNIDVVDYYNKFCILKKKYDCVFDICPNPNSIYKSNLNPNSKRIVYFTGSESEFANNAELKRIENLKQRRGICLAPRRQAPLIDRAVENFDGAVFIGNEYNLRTYKSFNLPKTYLVPNTGYDFENKINYDLKQPINFLYFGSSGCVHKGLDLLLEIFSEDGFPCNLYVCGNYENEEDFNEAYKDELYNCPNIFAFGFIDIFSEEFYSIASKCGFCVLPSCSEGMAGSVITCMSAGMIPLVSKECGLNDDQAIILRNNDIDTIREMILELSIMDKDDFKNRCKHYLHLTKTVFSDDAFVSAMRNAITEIVNYDE